MRGASGRLQCRGCCNTGLPALRACPHRQRGCSDRAYATACAPWRQALRCHAPHPISQPFQLADLQVQVRHQRGGRCWGWGGAGPLGIGHRDQHQLPLDGPRTTGCADRWRCNRLSDGLSCRPRVLIGCDKPVHAGRRNRRDATAVGAVTGGPRLQCQFRIHLRIRQQMDAARWRTGRQPFGDTGAAWRPPGIHCSGGGAPAAAITIASAGSNSRTCHWYRCPHLRPTWSCGWSDTSIS